MVEEQTNDKWKDKHNLNENIIKEEKRMEVLNENVGEISSSETQKYSLCTVQHSINMSIYYLPQQNYLNRKATVEVKWLNTLQLGLYSPGLKLNNIIQFPKP